MEDAESSSDRVLRRWATGLVVAFAIVVSANLYWQYLSHPEQRWAGLDNDRNYHFLLGQRLGMRLRSFDMVGYAVDFEAARTWPSLHGVLLSFVVAFAGPFKEVAVVPSLAGFAGTIVLAYLLVLRLAPAGGVLAGAMSAAFVAASPGMRIFATDAMLESLGACLTLAVLYAYVGYRSRPSTASAGWVGMCLSLLFLEKYNYWMIALLGVALVEVLRNRTGLVDAIRMLIPELPAWLRRQWKQPLNYLLLLVLVVVAYVKWTGSREFRLAGLKVEVSGQGHWYYVYLLMLARCVLEWRREGARIWNSLDPQLRAFLLWQGVPMGIWFLLPGRLAYFLGFLSTGNGANSDGKVLSAIPFYWQALLVDYHSTAAAAIAALAVGAVGVVAASFDRRRIGGVTVVAVLLAATFLAVKHPNRKVRFLNSWVPTLWVLGGVGAGVLLAASRRHPLSRNAVAVGIAGMTLWQLPSARLEGRSPEVGHFPGATTLTITDALLPRVAEDARVAMFGTLPMEYLLEWSYRERFPTKAPPEVRVKKFDSNAAANRERFVHWLKTTTADSVVIVDVPDDSPFFSGEAEFFRQFRELLSNQSVFTPTEELQPAGTGCKVTIWRRPAAVASRAETGRR